MTDPASAPTLGNDAVVRILVIEDERSLLKSLKKGLVHAGFSVDTAGDGEEGLIKARTVDYEVIVLDRDLPLVHGDEICRQLNESGAPSKVIMLTAASSLDELTEGLNIGADDYLAKPFRFPELVARIRALARRGGSPSPVLLTHGDIELDPARGVATRAGRNLELTHREFGVLEALLRADGQVVSAERLLETVWDENADPFTASVRVTMSRLRTKLGKPDVIDTVIGRGYRI
jgi:DNA-binding response OmpR family regulator